MSLKFTCPNCNETITADPALAGQPTECPECGWTVRMPQIDVLMANQELLKFLCPSCGRKLSATSEQFGNEMPCPFTDCQVDILVPRPDWNPVPSSIIKNKGTGAPSKLVSDAEEMTRKQQLTAPISPPPAEETDPSGT